MGEPDDVSPDELDAMAEAFFRWRYCVSCRTDLPTDEAVPPYSWVHDTATGEHRSCPRERGPGRRDAADGPSSAP